MLLYFCILILFTLGQAGEDIPVENTTLEEKEGVTEAPGEETEEERVVTEMLATTTTITTINTTYVDNSTSAESTPSPCKKNGSFRVTTPGLLAECIITVCLIMLSL